jgi:hypothetical protein
MACVLSFETRVLTSAIGSAAAVHVKLGRQPAMRGFVKPKLSGKLHDASPSRVSTAAVVSNE